MKVGIIGTGLMGGSLGLAIKKYHQGVKVFGDDTKKDNLTYALKHNLIDNKLDKNNLKEIKILFIAIPVQSIPDVIKEIKNYLSPDIIVSDLGSTKDFLYKKIKTQYPDLIYIPGHPMTGKETRGPQTAEADLFHNKNYILAGEDSEIKDEIEFLKEFISSLGARVITINPEKHDQMVALTSHLPQLLASSIIYEYKSAHKKTPGLKKVIGPAFLDFTRVAASDPSMWVDIFLTNKNNILLHLDNYISQLYKIRDLLNEEDQTALFSYLDVARRERKKLVGGKD